MKIFVSANVRQREEIQSKSSKQDIEFVFEEDNCLPKEDDNYEAIFYLGEDLSEAEVKKISGKPVFIDSVIDTLKQKNLPDNVSRINGWPEFLKRPTWEVASRNTIAASAIFEKIGWNVVFVKDEPGLISARVISMIVNEAFFALEENVSTADEIDKAMRLGTNYPYGPFEWLNIIGVKNIYLLLQKLSEKDTRYSIAPLLKKKYSELTFL